MAQLLRKLPLAEQGGVARPDQPASRERPTVPEPASLQSAAPTDEPASQLARAMVSLQAELEQLRQEVATLRAQLAAVEAELARQRARDQQTNEPGAIQSAVGVPATPIDRLAEPVAGASQRAALRPPRSARPDDPEPSVGTLARSNVGTSQKPDPRTAPPFERPDVATRQRSNVPTFKRANVQTSQRSDGDPDPGTAQGQPIPRSQRGGTRMAPLAASRLTRWASRLVIATTALICLAVLALTVGPRLLPYQTYIVLSGSMEPTIHVGSVVVLEPVAAKDLRIGDIITFQRPDRPDVLVTHRIVGIEEGQANRLFVTKGDANSTPDGWRVPAVGNGWRYEFSIPYVGYLLAAFQAPEGRLAFVVLPAIGLGVMTLIELWRPRRPAGLGS